MDSLITKLRPHQEAPVRQLLDIISRHQSAVDISDTGVGKTYVAAAVAKALQLPTLVVAPKIVISAWHRAFAHFGDTASVIGYEMLRTGKTPFGKWVGRIAKQPINKCQTCQTIVSEDSSPCFAHPQGIHCLTPAKTRGRKGRFEFAPQVQLCIFDEAHRTGALNSDNAELLIGVKRQNIKTLMLTATPATSPIGLRAIGYALDLHRLHDYYQFAARNGCRKIPPLPGIRWAVGADKQIEIMKSIRDSLIPARGVRVRVSDIPGFPKRDITAELYDIEEANKINSLYTEMAVALQHLDKKSSGDKSPDSPITRILRARQKVELLKVPVAAELASDYLDKNYSVGIFVNFRQTLDELRIRFPDACLIYGGQFDRDAHIERFQSNFSRIIIIMSEAGGVGLSLPDLSGVNPRVGLVMPTDKAVTMRQIFGRFHRDDSLSPCFYRVLLAAGTVETQMQRRLTQKFANLDMLNNGDMVPLCL